MSIRLFSDISLWLILSILFGYLFSFYVGGDQAAYIQFSEVVKGVSIQELSRLSLSVIGSMDYVYNLIIFAGVNLGFNHFLLISVVNSIFVGLCIYLLRKYEAPFFSYILLFSNYYILVLLFSSERLKFAIIFLLALIISSRKKILFMTLAILSHVQIVILLPGMISRYLGPLINRNIALFFGRLKIQGSFIGLVFATAIVVAIMILIFPFERTMQKAVGYLIATDASVIDFLKIGFLGLFSMFVLKNPSIFFHHLVWMIPAIFLIGGSRIYILMVLLIFVLHHLDGGRNKVIFNTFMVFFSVKSVPFILNIISYGDGFLVHE